MNKMKKTIIVLLFVLCLPRLSYSQDKKYYEQFSYLTNKQLQQRLSAYPLKLLDICEVLGKIEADLAKISQEEPHVTTMMSLLIVKSADLICYYESLLLMHLQNPLVVFTLYSPPSSEWNVLVRERIQEASKADLEIFLDTLGNLHMKSQHKPTLHFIDKARENIRTAVRLFNEIILILETDITEHKKNRSIEKKAPLK